MQACATMIYQLLECFGVGFDHFALFETVKNVRANIGRAANRRSVAEDLRRLLDRCHDLPFLTNLRLSLMSAGPCQSASANQRAGPSAKVFRAESFSHHFLDVIIDVPAFDVDKIPIAVLIIEHFR